jgi:hypothetical protein
LENCTSTKADDETVKKRASGLTGGRTGLIETHRIARLWWTIYCALQKYTVNSGLGICYPKGSNRPNPAGGGKWKRPLTERAAKSKAAVNFENHFSSLTCSSAPLTTIRA